MPPRAKIQIKSEHENLYRGFNLPYNNIKVFSNVVIKKTCQMFILKGYKNYVLP